MKYIKPYKIFENSDVKTSLPSENEIPDIFQEILDLDFSIRQIKYGYTVPDFILDSNHLLEPIMNKYSERHNTYRCICVIHYNGKHIPTNLSNNVINEFKFCKERLEYSYNSNCKLLLVNASEYFIIMTAK